MQLGNRTKPFQYSITTSRLPKEILEGLHGRTVPGIDIDEEGENYIVFKSRRRYKYSTDVAVGMGIFVLLVILILSAFFTPVLFLIPLALLPGLPLRLDPSAMVAVSAIDDPEYNATRITAHGEATAALSASLDAYFAGLPPPKVPVPKVEEPELSGSSEMHEF